MEVELLMRRPKALNKEEKEDLQIKRLTSNFSEDEDEDEEIKYEYSPITFNIENASPFFMYDESHTHIFLRGEELSFTAKVKYHVFQALKNSTTGVNVLKLTDGIEEVESDKPSTNIAHIKTRKRK